MPHKKARQAIDELNVELKRTPEETGALEGLLEQAREDIERFTPEALQDLMDALQRESDEFEVEHPRITSLINQVMHALGGLGI